MAGDRHSARRKKKTRCWPLSHGSCWHALPAKLERVNSLAPALWAVTHSPPVHRSDTARSMFGQGSMVPAQGAGRPAPLGGFAQQVTETRRTTTHVVSASASQHLNALRQRAEEMAMAQAHAAGAVATFEERLREKEEQLRAAEAQLRQSEAEARSAACRR